MGSYKLTSTRMTCRLTYLNRPTLYVYTQPSNYVYTHMQCGYTHECAETAQQKELIAKPGE